MPLYNIQYRLTTIVGIKTKEGVVLGSDKRASKGFFIGSKITQKITKVDETLAVAIAGQLSDAEYLVKVAKAERRLVELRRGFPLSVKESTRLIANLAYSGLKNYQPYFVELLVGGVDEAGEMSKLKKLRQRPLQQPWKEIRVLVTELTF